MTEPAATGLKRGALGTGDILFIVVSAAAPLMVMVGVAPIALLVGGVGAPTTYLFAGVTLTVFAVGFTTMSRHVSNAGGFYAYIRHGIGPGAGVTAALVALFSYNVLEIGVFGLLGISAHDTFKDLLGIDLHWAVWALIGVALVWYLGFRSIDFGAKVLAVLLTAETALLLVLAFAILFQGGAHGIGFDSLHPSNFLTSGNGTVLPMAFAAFMGFESTVIYRSEARDPRRTIARATYLAVGFLAVVYAFIVWSIVQAYGADGILPAAANDPVALFFTAANTYLGGWAVDLMHLLIVTSVLASLLAFHNAITRYTRAIAEEGMLPRILGAVHPRTRSPYVAGIVQTALATVVVVGFAVAHADPYRQLLIWVNTPGVLGILVLQVAVAVSVPVYFRRVPNDEGRWRTVVAPLLAVAGMVAALYLTSSHLELLTAASSTVNRTLQLSVVAACVAGVGWALWLRRNRPEVYAAVAADAVEKETDGAVR
jgi:amino acid transporter